MTRGTRIFLLIAGLFVGVLVVYYGFYTDTLNPDEVATATDETDETVAPEGSGASATDRSQAGNASSERQSSAEAQTPARREPSRTEPSVADEQRRETVVPPVRTPERRLRDPLTENPPPVVPPSNGSTDGSATGNTKPVAPPPGPRGGHAEAPRSNQPAGQGRATGGNGRGERGERGVNSNQPATIKTSERRYVIQADDSLYRIAERELDDPQQWRRILAANPGLRADALPIGDSIIIPPKATSRPATKPTTASGPLTHVVQSGDNLSSISEQYYGTEAKWQVIFKANAKLIGSDPDALKLGMRLTIPVVK